MKKIAIVATAALALVAAAASPAWATTSISPLRAHINPCGPITPTNKICWPPPAP